MKKLTFLKLVSVATIAAAISMFSLTGCSEDPAANEGGPPSDISSSSGGNNNPSVIPKITIVNNTGYTIASIYIKPSISTDWGSELLRRSSLSDGTSKIFTLSQSLSTHSEYDIKLQGSNNVIFTKYKFTVSNDMTITFSASDLTDESNFPSITIQNRTGVNFNSIYVKPSSAPDTAWGNNYISLSSLSNNSDKSISIPIPPTSYTEFDVQVRSTNPTATYTKRVTVSNGMILTYTREDSDSPLTGSPVIVIENNTGYTIASIYIKPSISTDWGSELLRTSSLSDGTSKTFTLSQSLSANSVDIKLQRSGSIFTKYNFTVSDGMIITFDASDLTDESELPSITIQNRAGVSFNSIYVKPTSAPDTDWGNNYISLSSLSNNSDKSISIPIPPSNYTEFDVQVRSTNPTATYTKRVTVSNGMILTYTRADSDSPLTGSPVIVIENNTGFNASYIYIRESGSTTWPSSLSGSIADGVSRAYTSSALSASTVDIRLGTNGNISSGNQFVKSNVPMQDGMIVTLTGSDLYQPE